MRSYRFGTGLLLLWCVALLAAGCGSGGRSLTEGISGRRVNDYDVDGPLIAYEWTPAQKVSTQGHLVVLDTTTGTEVELEGDLQGPFALSGTRVVWWNARSMDAERKSDLLLFDVTSNQMRTLAHEQIARVDIDGDYVVWEAAYGNSSDIILYDLGSDTRKVLSVGGLNGTMTNRYPVIAGGVVAWEAYDPAKKRCTLVTCDLATDRRTSVDVPGAHLRASLAPPYLVYRTARDGAKEIHLFDIADESDRVIATPVRLQLTPYVEGNLIVWGEHIPKEEFSGVPGQPLMDEKDFRDLVVYDIATGGTRRVAKGVLCSDAKLFGGKVYATVYRELPPPGKSNMIVPVDLQVF